MALPGVRTTHRGFAALLRCAAWLYLLVLCGLAGAFRWVGEGSWISLAALYLPRWPLALPLLALVPALLVGGPRRLLWTQVASAALVAFPLLGLRVHLPRERLSDGPSIRVLSYNVWLGARGTNALRAEILAAKPDLVLLQTTSSEVQRLFEDPYFAGWSLRREDRLSLASRYPVGNCSTPEGLSTGSGPPFLRCTVATPLGLLEVFNVHAISPRLGLDRLRRALRRGHFPGDADLGDLLENRAVRERQIRGLAEAAARSRNPVLIAGDTNLPGGSRTLRDHLSRYRDAFDEVGCGFGYTFPTVALRPWMRIDRALAGDGLRFLSVRTGGEGGSDHRPLLVEVARSAHGY